MLTEKSMEDSLNDSLQPAQLKKLEDEFETNHHNQYENSIKKDCQVYYQKPLCSYRYTYSSEESQDEDDQQKENESINSVVQQQTQFQTFGKNDEVINEVKDYIKQNNYSKAYQTLIQFQQINKKEIDIKQSYYFKYLMTQIYFGLQKYKEMFALGKEIIQTQYDFVNHTLDMLINASLIINQYEEALDYELKLINKCEVNPNEQFRLGQIYILLNKQAEAYYSFLLAYKNGNQVALENLVDIGYSIDKKVFKELALKYIQNSKSNNPKILAKVYFYLAKDEQDIQNALYYQQQGFNNIKNINGIKDQSTLSALINLAEIKFQLQLWSEAQQDFELCQQIISQLDGQINTKFLYCQMKLSYCEFYQNNLTSAKSNFEKCYNLSIQGNIQKQYQERIIFNITYIEIILKIDFTNSLQKLISYQNSTLLNEIGIILQKNNHIDQAINLYQEALKWCSKDQQVLINFNLAGCYGIKKDFQRSVDIFKSCSIEVDENTKCEIERKISQIYYSCSKFRESLFHLKRALQIAKQNNLTCQKDIKEELKKF